MNKAGSVSCEGAETCLESSADYFSVDFLLKEVMALSVLRTSHTFTTRQFREYVDKTGEF